MKEGRGSQEGTSTAGHGKTGQSSRYFVNTVSDGAWRLAHEDHPLCPDLIMPVASRRSKSATGLSVWRREANGGVLPMGAFGACPAPCLTQTR